MRNSSKVVATAIASLFLISLFEIVLRLNWSLLLKRESPTARYVEFSLEGGREKTEAPPTQSLISAPYGLYRNNPAYVSNTEPSLRQNDENGYRNPAYGKGNNCVVILAYGGSTTNEYPYVKRAESWTMRLKDMLQQHKGLVQNRKDCVQVYNAAVTYGTSAEIVSDYMFRGKFLKPDLIVLHTGGNDGLALWQKEYTTDYSHIRSSQTSNPLQVMLSGEGKTPRILRFVGSNSAIAKHALFLVAKAYPAGGVYHPHINGEYPLSPAESLKQVRTRNPLAFRNNLTNLLVVAKNESTPVLMVPFLLANKPNVARNFPALRGYEQMWVESVEKHTQVLKQLAAKHSNAYFLQLDKTKFKEEFFLDYCHLDARGSLEKGRQIYEGVLAVLKNQMAAKGNS